MAIAIDPYLFFPGSTEEAITFYQSAFGGDVSITLESSNPPPPPVGENAAWQAVNKATNAKINVTIIPFGELNAKWATVQAGNDLPDLMYHQVYACGGPAMIDAARKEFSAQCKLPAEEFFADSFTYAVQPAQS